MTWLLLALGAPLLWAASNLIDGQLVRVRIKDPLTILALIGMFSAIPAVVMFLIGRPLVAVSLSVVLLSVLTGVISLLSYYPYLHVLKTEHPASAVLLWNLSPVFVVAAAAVFLQEHLDIGQFISVTFLVASAVTASPLFGDAASGGQSVKTKMARQFVFLMVVASVLTAAEALLLKGLFEVAQTTAVMCIVLTSSAVSGAAIVAGSSDVRRRIRTLFSSTGWTLVAMNELLNQGGLIAARLAVSVGSVSLTKAIEGLQPIFIIGFGIIARRAFRASRLKIPNAPPFRRALIATALALVGLALVRT